MCLERRAGRELELGHRRGSQIIFTSCRLNVYGWSRHHETGPMVLFLDEEPLTQRARGMEWVIKTWNFIDKQAFFFLVGGG